VTRAYQVSRVHTWNPNGTALAVMGVTAQRAAREQTMREWAARLATRAGPKDYRGQLRELFAGIVKRWRYVMEGGEWLHGTADSLLAHVLGAKYNAGPTCPSPTRCDVEATPWREHGWGDCDDVATLTAAGVLALGMRPLWRVSRGPAGAHVAVTAITPNGERVELDPVLHPHQGFNEVPVGPGVSHQHFNLEGQPVEGFGAVLMQHFTRPYHPNFVPTYMGAANGSVYMGATEPMPGDAVPTMIGTLRVLPGGGLAPFQARDRPHLCVVHPSDMRGARVLAVPAWHADMMRRGVVWHRTPAVDQFGQAWRYNSDMDHWLPERHVLDREWTPGAMPAGTNAARWAHDRYLGAAKSAQRAERKARRAARVQRRRAAVRKAAKKVGTVLKKVHRGFQKVGAAILNSKFVQTIVAGVLQVFGVPMPVTKKLMSVAGSFMGRGGLGQLLKLARKSPKDALKFLAESVKGAGRSDLLKQLKIPGFSGPPQWGEPLQYEMSAYGSTYHAAPVEVIVGLPGVYEFGFGKDMSITPKPTPGHYYRVQKGDNLLSVAKAAYGPDQSITHAKWINNALVNQVYMRPAQNDFERKYIGPEIVSFRPIWSADPADALEGQAGDRLAVIWIPPAGGVEPPTEPVEPVDDLPDVEPIGPIGPTPSPPPMPPGPAPVPVDDLDDEDVDDATPPAPIGPDADDGLKPVPWPDDERPIPPRPDDAPPEDDDGEPGADEGATDTDIIENGLKPVPWPDDAPADDGGGGAIAAAAGMLALLTLL
jgi:hypothetical protein